MRCTLQWFIYLRAHGLRKGDEQPAYTPHEVRHSFTFYLLFVANYNSACASLQIERVTLNATDCSTLLNLTPALILTSDLDFQFPASSRRGAYTCKHQGQLVNGRTDRRTDTRQMHYA